MPLTGHKAGCWGDRRSVLSCSPGRRHHLRYGKSNGSSALQPRSSPVAVVMPRPAVSVLIVVVSSSCDQSSCGLRKPCPRPEAGGRLLRKVLTIVMLLTCLCAAPSRWLALHPRHFGGPLCAHRCPRWQRRMPQATSSQGKSFEAALEERFGAPLTEPHWERDAAARRELTQVRGGLSVAVKSSTLAR